MSDYGFGDGSMVAKQSGIIRIDNGHRQNRLRERETTRLSGAAWPTTNRKKCPVASQDTREASNQDVLLFKKYYIIKHTPWGPWFITSFLYKSNTFHLWIPTKTKLKNWQLNISQSGWQSTFFFEFSCLRYKIKFIAVTWHTTQRNKKNTEMKPTRKVCGGLRFFLGRINSSCFLFAMSTMAYISADPKKHNTCERLKWNSWLMQFQGIDPPQIIDLSPWF